MNDKLQQTIEKRLFWADYSINMVLDSLHIGLYDSTCFVKMNDGFSYLMKNSKTKFSQGLTSCVSQSRIDVHSFFPQKIITVNSLYGFTSATILNPDKSDEKWLFVIYGNLEKLVLESSYPALNQFF